MLQCDRGLRVFRGPAMNHAQGRSRTRRWIPAAVLALLTAAGAGLTGRAPGADAPGAGSPVYVKESDQITETQLSQKAQRDRYSGAIHQVALRSIHEIFEADRRGIVRTISLEVGTSTISPATGRETYIPFVSAAAERASFLEIDLSAVVPNATLKHLGAAVSKNPFGLVPADTKGVRRA